MEIDDSPPRGMLFGRRGGRRRRGEGFNRIIKAVKTDLGCETAFNGQYVGQEN